MSDINWHDVVCNRTFANEMQNAFYELYCRMEANCNRHIWHLTKQKSHIEAFIIKQYCIKKNTIEQNKSLNEKHKKILQTSNAKRFDIYLMLLNHQYSYYIQNIVNQKHELHHNLQINWTKWIIKASLILDKNNTNNNSIQKRIKESNINKNNTSKNTKNSIINNNNNSNNKSKPSVNNNNSNSNTNDNKNNKNKNNKNKNRQTQRQSAKMKSNVDHSSNNNNTNNNNNNQTKSKTKQNYNNNNKNKTKANKSKLKIAIKNEIRSNPNNLSKTTKLQHNGNRKNTNTNKIKHKTLNKENNDCKYCEQRFSNQQSLNKHIHNIHRSEKSYTCKICFKKYRIYAKLINHMRLHILQ